MVWSTQQCVNTARGTSTRNNHPGTYLRPHSLLPFPCSAFATRFCGFASCDDHVVDGELTIMQIRGSHPASNINSAICWLFSQTLMWHEIVVAVSNDVVPFCAGAGNFASPLDSGVSPWSESCDWCLSSLHQSIIVVLLFSTEKMFFSDSGRWAE
jgi:hypothetical protein